MATKLTLRLDDVVIKDAKRYARSRRTSLSRVVNEYFKALSQRQAERATVTPILDELSGIIASSGTASGLVKEYKKHLERKYL